MFWRYVHAPELREGVQGGVTGRLEDVGMSLTLSPSLLTGDVLQVEYRLNQAGPASITLFDISGREVVRGDFIGARAEQLSLDLHFLSAGIYLVRLEDGHQSLVRKLVVQR